MLWLIVTITVLFLLIGGFILFVNRAGGFGFPWISFYAKGRESGFSFHEINLLRRVAVDNRLTDPTSLFWSIRQLDRCIKGTIIKLRTEGQSESEGGAGFISKLFDFRRNIELSLPKYTLGLKSSRKIDTHQRLRLTLPGQGTYVTRVVENLRKYMAVSYPEGPSLPQGFTWTGQKLNVYFWRQDDAGYVFQTRVIDDYSDRKFPILHISHSENIVRSQKRSSVRVDANFNGSLYPLKNVNLASEEVEHAPGLKCRVLDISETGAAILVGGRAKAGLPIKIQFNLVNRKVIMCGVVKGVNFDSKKNQSILHMEALPLTASTKNHVLSYVYNIFEEREERIKRKKTVQY